MFELSDISIIYPPRTIIDGLCASFLRGRTSGIIGPNGVGKTTLFRGICGAVKMSEGSVRLDGEPVDVGGTEWKRRMTLIPDDNALFGDLTIEEHFEMMRLLFELDRSEGDERSTRLIEIFDLSHYSNRTAEELSFGFRKRLAIALALYRDAEVYLFDEPFVGLDVASVGLFGSIIDCLERADRIIIIASHELEVLSELCTSIRVLARGTLHEIDGTVSRTSGYGVDEIGDLPQKEAVIPWLASRAT